MNRTTVGIGVIGLVIGLLIGYLWWGQAARRLAADVPRLEGQIAEFKHQSEDLQVRLTTAEGQLKGLTDELRTERELRQRYEGLVGSGRK
jgi:hypothetical protein